MIDFNFQPQPLTIAKTTAVNLAFRFGMQTGRYLEVKEFDGTFSSISDLENRPWLTSLRMSTHYEGELYSLLFQEVMTTFTNLKSEIKELAKIDYVQGSIFDFMDEEEIG